jgi:6-phosphofructokinase 1
VTKPMNAIAVLTSGGDAPGMNAAIRTVVQTAVHRGVSVVGVRGGFRGLMAGDFTPLDPNVVANIIPRGGTMLGSARAPRFKEEEGQQEAVINLERMGIGGLIVIGGNGSQTGARAMHTRGFPTVGVASTIDNDLHGFEMTIGVDTALNTALGMIDRLRDTASSHNRAFVVEVMGRDSGYLATMTGIASGAEMILTPEFPATMADVREGFRQAHAHRKSHFIIIAAEGSPLKAMDVVAGINAMEGHFYEGRLSILGHVQRGGSPMIFDRLLAARSAALATASLLDGKSGYVAGLSGGDYRLVPVNDAITPNVKVTKELFELAGVLGE